MSQQNNQQPLIHALSTQSVDKPRATGKGAPLLVVCLTLLASQPAGASGVNDSLGDFFDGLGHHTNVTNPSTYKGQSANYYNGGGLYARTKIVNAQLAAVTLPSINAGCGGIDAFMGAFSHINSDQLVQFGKAVVANAAPFAVDLALQTWAPQIKQIKDFLHSVADKWLNQSINSCETAQAAVGGLAAFAGGQVKEHVCASMGTQNNTFADWVAAKHECGVGGQAPVQLAQARKEPQYEELTKTEHNIVWSATMKNGFLASDPELAEFLMTISGTYVYDADGKPTYYPSLLTDNNNLVQALLEGGNITTYRCDDRDEKKCLVLTNQTVNISVTKGLQYRVRKVLEELYTALLNDDALTLSQKSFLEYSNVPVLAFLKDYAAVKAAPTFDKYARIMSVDLVNKYLTNMLNVTRHSLSNTQNDPKDIEIITRDITEAKQFTKGLKENAIRELNELEEMIAKKRQQREIIATATSKKTRKNISFGE